MSSISLFSGVFTHAETIAEKISSVTGYQIIRDHELIEEASKKYEISKEKIERAVYGKTSVFDKFTHEKQRSIAYLKTVLADYLTKDRILYLGFLGQLIPKRISHVLQALVIAEMKHRVQQASKDQGLSEKEALKLIHKKDENAFLWTEYIFKKEPWDSSLYDIVIPSGKVRIDESVNLIVENLKKDAVKSNASSEKAVGDFALAAQIEVTLAGEGHDVTVSADNGNILLLIEKNVIMLSKLEEELKTLIKDIPGVKDVQTKAGKNFYQTDIYRKYDFELSPKVLLVDDEREFVQTLSDRLQMREVGAHVVYGGEEALDLVKEEEPEVMVLDLKMPGINGIEVLKQVKKTHPAMEVIVLTGHGSEKDKTLCMELGAFAYLEKPVDIEQLTKTMNEANAKLKKKKK
ncbi:MAG: response regulator [Deltaproteobacteria bacterium]|nr:response regulator [Deltaproteobacteria bacterium]